jgi:hypothetical protein
MNWTPYIAVWSFFAVIVLALAAYRKMLSGREDDTLHVSEGASRLIPLQIANAHRIEVVEKWGKSLTAVVVLAGLIMGAIYLYGVWQIGSGVPVMMQQ